MTGTSTHTPSRADSSRAPEAKLPSPKLPLLVALAGLGVVVIAGAIRVVVQVWITARYNELNQAGGGGDEPDRLERLVTLIWSITEVLMVVGTAALMAGVVAALAVRLLRVPSAEPYREDDPDDGSGMIGEPDDAPPVVARRGQPTAAGDPS